MKLSERWNAYRKIVEVPSPSDKLGDEMADLLDECESFIESRTCMCIPKLKCTRCEMLAKIRAQERG